MAYIPTIVEARIAANAVTSAKIADDAVTTSEILNATILGTDIAGDTITATQIAASAIGSSELATSSVVNTKIATGAVEEAKLAAGSVSTAKIQLLAITTAVIADDAVTAAKIADGLDDIAAATASTTSITASNQKIVNLADPTLAQDAATKAYVDALAVGLDPKESVLYTTTGNITLSGLGTQANATHPASLTAGDRILVKDQTDPIDNGIYTAAAGAWTRSTDFDGTPASEVSNGAFTLVAAGDGTSEVGTGWTVTSADPIVVDTDPIVFTQITSPGAVTTLDSLTDVDTTGVVTHALLRFDGTNWVDTANVKIDDASKQLNIDGATLVGNTGGLTITASNGLVVSGETQFSSLLRTNSGIRVKQTTRTANATLSEVDFLTIADTSAGAITLTLPLAPTNGLTYRIKRRGANALTIDGNGTLIDNAATLSIGDFEAFDLVYANAEWQVF